MKNTCIVTQDTNRYLRMVDEATEREEWINDRANELIAEYKTLIKNFSTEDEKADTFFGELMLMVNTDEIDRLIRTVYSREHSQLLTSFVDTLIEQRALADAENEFDRLDDM